jgi:hypothetical protein
VKKHLCLFSALCFVLMFPSNSPALFGTSIGPVPCLVGCGGKRGAINFQWGGDLINNMLLGPSIDNFDEKLAARGAALIQAAKQELDNVLKANLKELEAIGERALNTLDDNLRRVAHDSVAQLDQTLKNSIDKADDALRDQQSHLGVTLYQIVGTLQTSLIAVAALALVMGVLFYAGLRYSHGSTNLSVPQRNRLLYVAGAILLLAIVFIFLASYLLKTSVQRQLSNKVVAAVEAREFNEALFSAGQLKLLEPRATSFRLQEEKLRLVRDYYFRPTQLASHMDPAGYLRRVLNVANDTYLQFKRVDADMLGILALVTWKLGDGRVAEYFSAQLAAEALTSYKGEPNEKMRTLERPLKALLTKYLMHPVSTDELKVYGAAIESEFSRIAMGVSRRDVGAIRELATQKEEEVGLGLAIRKLSLQTQDLYAAVINATITGNLYATVPSWGPIIASHLDEWRNLVKGKSFAETALAERLLVLKAPHSILARLEAYRVALEKRSVTYDGGALSCTSVGAIDKRTDMERISDAGRKSIARRLPAPTGMDWSVENILKPLEAQKSITNLQYQVLRKQILVDGVTDTLALYLLETSLATVFVPIGYRHIDCDIAQTATCEVFIQGPFGIRIPRKVECKIPLEQSHTQKMADQARADAARQAAELGLLVCMNQKPTASPLAKPCNEATTVVPLFHLFGQAPADVHKAFGQVRSLPAI